MLALMEQDRFRPPRRIAFALPSVFALLAILSPPLLTVSLGDQTPWSLPATLPDWLDRAATCAAGAALGGVVARLAKPRRLRHRQSSASLAPALLLLGISLGWQAVVTIAVLWFVAMKILKRSGGQWMRPRWLTATTLLFVVAMPPHPAWKWLAGQVSS